MPVRGQPRNPLGQRPQRFHRLRTFGGSDVSVDTVGEQPLRFHERARVVIVRPGETPGTSETDRSTGIEAAGQIRRLWHQLISPVPAPPPFPVSAAPFTGQRTIRYRAQSVYRRAGNQLRFARGGVQGLHTVIVQQSRQDRPTIGTGQNRNRPTVRNRMTSFGSRVPPLNPRVPADSVSGS